MPQRRGEWVLSANGKLQVLKLQMGSCRVQPAHFQHSAWYQALPCAGAQRQCHLCPLDPGALEPMAMSLSGQHPRPVLPYARILQGPIVAILCGYVIVFCLVSGFALKRLNFQNR